MNYETPECCHCEESRVLGTTRQSHIFVIASPVLGARQSQISKTDCFVASAPRNDKVQRLLRYARNDRKGLFRNSK
ncbi:hypothetical protein KKA96_03700 [Patescibacteria group bacterium]|nr:hypothetical protein [Patescibacteria group bacterium]